MLLSVRVPEFIHFFLINKSYISSILDFHYYKCDYNSDQDLITINL